MTKSSVGKAKNPESARRWHPDVVDPLVAQLSLLRQDMLELEQVAASWWQSIPDEHQCSGRNLLHYVSLRRHDIRELQEQLVLRGLSSLGRCESHVMENVEAVLAILSDQATQQVTSLPPQSVPVCFQRGRELLKQSTQRLFGKNAEGEPLIMVTMPGEAGADYGLVRDLLEAGMNSMRINCAHDDGTAWSGMIDNLRRAERELGRSCRVVMDLAGPKVRTGNVEEGPKVICWKPSRNEYGQVICPVRLWFSSDPNAVPLYDAQLVIRTHDDWWKSVRQGDVLRLRDAGGRRRRLQVIQATSQGLLVESSKTAYITPKTVFKLEVREGKEGKTSGKILGRIGDIPSQTGYLFLQEGDSLQITGADAIGHPARYDEHGRMISMASIGCTLPEVFAYVHPGERVLLDDGKISTVVTEASALRLIVQVTRAGQKGTRLRADKGMNFPDTSLHLPALTDADVENLKFIVQHADIVSYSFVHRPEDVRQLNDHLVRLGKPDLGVILKIENRQAFENLPLLLLEAMRCFHATGVMIARGDLAVECGWERLVEVQEEILWMTEAAHMPVVWATQVLEGMAKNGMPTRAEITDAGVGARAECVMLNKGPNIVETVRILHDILLRMQQHQIKKRSTFRRLRMAEGAFG